VILSISAIACALLFQRSISEFSHRALGG
jgi:hypothetical protein